MCPTRQTYCSWWRCAKDAQADGTNKANVNYTLVAEAGGPEVYVDLRGHDEVATTGLVGKKGHHESLEKTERIRESDVDAIRSVRSLLKEYSVACEFEYVYWYFLGWLSVCN
jgi:hypothetical protein